MIRRSIIILACAVAMAGCDWRGSPPGGVAPMQPIAPSALVSDALSTPPPVATRNAVTVGQSGPLILPRGGSLPGPEAEQLPAIGTPLVDFRCLLQRNEKAGWFVLHGVDESGKPAGGPDQWVLLNHVLEATEPYASSQTPLLVSGEIQIYKGRPFVLLTGPIETAAPATKPAEPPKPPEGPAATLPAATSQAVHKASAEDIRNRLAGERTGTPMPVPLSPQREDVKPVESVAPVPRGNQGYEAGRMLVDQLARLVRDDQTGWLMVRFESDNTLQEPPLRLLPCSLLERAERLAAASQGRMIRFRVSGEVTQYKGNQYLLLRKLVTEHEMNEL